MPTEGLNVDQFYDRLLKAAARREYHAMRLGFHGEEPAGPLGALQFLEKGPQAYFDTCAITWIPLVNPTGARKAQRLNKWGENPNKGYCTRHDHGNKWPLSQEGKLLEKHMPLIVTSARSGMLSLHEDSDLNEFCLYVYEDAESPTDFAYAVRDAGARHFPVLPDGPYDKFYSVKDGFIFKPPCTSGFEDRLAQESALPWACSETPGRQSLHQRVAANVDLITAFLAHRAQQVE
jgi:hypothetical protein